MYSQRPLLLSSTYRQPFGGRACRRSRLGCCVGVPARPPPGWDVEVEQSPRIPRRQRQNSATARAEVRKRTSKDAASGRKLGGCCSLWRAFNNVQGEQTYISKLRAPTPRLPNCWESLRRHSMSRLGPAKWSGCLAPGRGWPSGPKPSLRIGSRPHGPSRSGSDWRDRSQACLAAA